MSRVFGDVTIGNAMPRISEVNLKRVLALDAKVINPIATRPYVDAYIEKNITLYDFSITLWLCLLSDAGDFSPMKNHNLLLHIVDNITDFGLINVIKLCDEAADTFITTQPSVDFSSIRPDGICQWMVEMWDGTHDAKSILQCLRFLKRLSPLETEPLEQGVWDEFCRVERILEMGDRRRFSFRLTREGEEVIPCNHPFVTDVQHHQFPLGHILDRSQRIVEQQFLIRARELASLVLADYTEARGLFSNGAIFDGQKPKASKLQSALHHGSGYLNQYWNESPLCFHSPLLTPAFAAKWITVNKNFKTRRPIAVEECSRQWHLQGIRKGIEKCLYSNTNIRLDDQTINQEYAIIGSRDRTYATIDLKGASDHISYGLAKAILPEHLFSEIVKYRATTVFHGKSAHVCKKFATSGSAVCFPVETLIFWVLTVIGCEYAATFLNKRFTRRSWNHIHIYGDDIICPTWAAETVCDVLTLFDFEVNESKTHYRSDDPYRESCGIECLNGEDISTVFFPRKTLVFSQDVRNTKREYPETVIALTDLQHRLLVSNYSTASRFVERCVKTLVPDMTYSHIYSDYQDLWSISPAITTLCYGESTSSIVNDYQRDIEVHYGYLTKYPSDFEYAIHPLTSHAEALALDLWFISKENCQSPELLIDEILEVLDNPTLHQTLLFNGKGLLCKLYK